MLNLVLLGPPGAGKGTQAQKIAKHYGIPHISTGNIFREAISNKTPLGQIAARYINDGNLVPDDVTIGLVKERLSEADTSNGYLLDGFPRTLPQAKALQEIGDELNKPIAAVINIAASTDELVTRISGRRVCSNCGAPYHIETLKPRVAGVCDICDGELIQRLDDTAEAFKTRLAVYTKDSAPLEDYYEDIGLLINVNGLLSIDQLFSEIIALLDEVNE